MGKPIYILSYFKEQYSEFEKNYLVARETYDENAIHDMRVAIKKLKALFLFLEHLSEHQFNSSKNYLFYRRVFKSSGKIRDVQIQEQIIYSEIKGLNINCSIYIAHLKQKEEDAKRKFRSICKKTESNSQCKVHNRVLKIVDRLEGLDIKRKGFDYLLNKLNYIDFLSKKAVNSEKWHEIRTHIKQALYIIDLLNLFFEPDELLLSLHKKLKKFGERLGKWHDYDITYEQLRKFINENILNQESADMFKLLNKIAEKQ